MIRFLINRPIAVIMSFVLIMILGIFASQKTPVSILPNSNIPKLEIILNNPGDSPEDFDTEVVEKVRNNLMQLNNIVDVNSYSNNSTGKIELIFDYGTDLELTFFEVNEKIDEVLSVLPYKINRPKVVKSSLSDIPSLYLSVGLRENSKKSFAELSSFLEEKIKPRLEQTSEIAFVDVTGLAQNVIKVVINEKRINPLGITLSDIKNVFNDNNFSFGNIEISQGNFVYDLSIENSINSVENIKNMQLQIDDKVITLSDIAEVTNDLKFEDEYFYNLNKAISLAVIKSPNHSEKDFIQTIDNIINDLHTEYPNINISKTKDQTVILKETLNSLTISLILGMFLAIIITLFFLRTIQNVILIIIAVIASLVIDMLLFYVFNISINLISVSGLILGIGLMIDNIIIVLDNIEQKITTKGNIKEGCVDGVNEIITALISSALTTCSIFIPLIFLSGLAGVLFYDQAISVSITLLSSFFVSIILLPTLYILINKKIKSSSTNNRAFPIYGKLYNKIDKKKTLTFLCLFVILLFGYISFLLIEKNQLPKLESSELVFKIEWNQNLINEELIDRSTKIINLIKDDVFSSEFYINEQNFLSKTDRKNIQNYETYYILKLKDKNRKEILKQDLLSKVKHQDINLHFLAEENALNTILVSEEYNLKIISYDKEITSEILKKEIEKKHTNLSFSSIGKTKRIEFSIHQERVIAYGIDKNAIVEFIKLKLGQEKLLDINYGNSIIPVTFYSSQETLDTLLNSKFTTKKGNQYTLKDLITVKYKKYKKGVEADIGGVADILYVKTETPKLIIDSVKKMFPESTISFGGSYKLLEKLKKEVIYIVIITLILLYLILSIQFESLKLPIIILLEIPIDISVSVIILYLTNQSLNVMSFIGIIIMSGIIINDSILKIDLINKLYKKGLNIEEAIHTASKRRLNAILMTSLTTILAVTPILFQNDISTQLQIPLIISLIAGLFIGTLVSIFIIPILYKKLI
jgi:multidrug efflux pump subunit AcrB